MDLQENQLKRSKSFDGGFRGDLDLGIDEEQLKKSHVMDESYLEPEQVKEIMDEAFLAEKNYVNMKMNDHDTLVEALEQFQKIKDKADDHYFKNKYADALFGWAKNTRVSYQFKTVLETLNRYLEDGSNENLFAAMDAVEAYITKSEEHSKTSKTSRRIIAYRMRAALKHEMEQKAEEKGIQKDAFANIKYNQKRDIDINDDKDVNLRHAKKLVDSLNGHYFSTAALIDQNLTDSEAEKINRKLAVFAPYVQELKTYRTYLKDNMDNPYDKLFAEYSSLLLKKQLFMKGNEDIYSDQTKRAVQTVNAMDKSLGLARQGKLDEGDGPLDPDIAYAVHKCDDWLLRNYTNGGVFGSKDDISELVTSFMSMPIVDRLQVYHFIETDGRKNPTLKHFKDAQSGYKPDYKKIYNKLTVTTFKFWRQFSSSRMMWEKLEQSIAAVKQNEDLVDEMSKERYYLNLCKKTTLTEEEMDYVSKVSKEKAVVLAKKDEIEKRYSDETVELPKVKEADIPDFDKLTDEEEMKFMKAAASRNVVMTEFRDFLALQLKSGNDLSKDTQGQATCKKLMGLLQEADEKMNELSNNNFQNHGMLGNSLDMDCVDAATLAGYSALGLTQLRKLEYAYTYRQYVPYFKPENWNWAKIEVAAFATSSSITVISNMLSILNDGCYLYENGRHMSNVEIGLKTANILNSVAAMGTNIWTTFDGLSHLHEITSSVVDASKVAYINPAISNANIALSTVTIATGTVSAVSNIVKSVEMYNVEQKEKTAIESDEQLKEQQRKEDEQNAEIKELTNEEKENRFKNNLIKLQKNSLRNKTYDNYMQVSGGVITLIGLVTGGMGWIAGGIIWGLGKAFANNKMLSAMNIDTTEKYLDLERLAAQAKDKLARMNSGEVETFKYQLRQKVMGILGFTSVAGMNKHIFGAYADRIITGVQQNDSTYITILESLGLKVGKHKDGTPDIPSKARIVARFNGI